MYGLEQDLRSFPQAVLAAALVGAPVLHLAESAIQAERAGADVLHIDVMDGHMTEQISFGAAVVRALADASTIPLDVHLLTSQPDRQASAFLDAGAALLSFHVEASENPRALLRNIRARGRGAGLAISPSTPLARASELIDDLDLLIVMTAHPGTSQLTETCEERVSEAADILRRHGSAARLAVDGGIKLDNIGNFAARGADWFVTASALFGDPRGIAAAAQDLQERAKNGQQGRDASRQRPHRAEPVQG